MTSIINAKEEDFQLLADIGRTTFIESHGHSAEAADINRYADEKYNAEVIRDELADPENIYHTLYHDDQLAGYSKIILDTPHPVISSKNVTKLERIYLLKEFYGLKLGAELFAWNLALSRDNNQAGIWLYVWKENYRAVGFYQKTGFKIVGSYDFQLTATHTNPNHIMFLQF
jgi:ribosomal protein S18 acetylase RimI-like enzyme